MLLRLRRKFLKLHPSCLLRYSPNSSIFSFDHSHLTFFFFTWLHFHIHGSNREKRQLLTAIDLLGLQICTGYKRSWRPMIDNKQYSINHIPQSNKGKCNAWKQVKKKIVITPQREMGAKVKFSFPFSRPQ